jgi:hypothetical protein
MENLEERMVKILADSSYNHSFLMTFLGLLGKFWDSA